MCMLTGVALHSCWGRNLTSSCSAWQHLWVATFYNSFCYWILPKVSAGTVPLSCWTIFCVCALGGPWSFPWALQTLCFCGIWCFSGVIAEFGVSHGSHGTFAEFCFFGDIKYTFHDGIVSLVQAQYALKIRSVHLTRRPPQSLFTQAYSLDDDKVGKYLSEEGQPGLQFLKDVQLDYPKKTVEISSNLTGVPGWSDVPQSEWDWQEASNLGPAAAEKAYLGSSVDCSLFWNSCASELPAIPMLALR